MSLNTIDLTYSKELEKAFDIAKKIAKNNSNKYYSAAHLLKAILNRDLSLLKQLESMGKDVFYLEEWAEVRIEEQPKSSHVMHSDPDESIDTVISEAESVRFLLGKDEVDLYCIVAALSTPGVAFSFDKMKAYPVSRNELLEGNDMYKYELQNNSENVSNFSQSTQKGFLGKYCIHINKQKKDALNFVGRDMELNSMLEILCRYVKPNVLLLGDHGIGKTTLINGFCNLVIEGKVPEILMKTQIHKLDLGSLIAGASYKGEIEDRLKNIAEELRTLPKSILIIEEINTLMDKHGSDSGAANILKSEMTKGLTIIASSTIEDFSKKIEKEQGFAKMFEILKVEEANDDTNFRMIKKSISKYVKHHKIDVDDSAITESIRLARRYLKEKSLPESSIDLIDHTMSVLKTAGEAFLKEKEELYNNINLKEANTDNLFEEELLKELRWVLSDLLSKNQFLLTMDDKDVKKPESFLLKDDIIRYYKELLIQIEKRALEKRSNIEALDLGLIIAKKTGIPVGKLQDQEKQKLGAIHDILRQRVVGQDQAIDTVSETILESRSGLSKAGQPSASFFFLGPTGTGKTELAKTLAEFLFQDENAIIRFDMSEFKEEHSAALLYGAPPGYVGYEEGGLLVNKIRQKPYSIVLFDEIEKAHTSVFDVFLQIMDEGKLHDRLGKEGDFSNALVLFTSNIGSEFIIESFESGNIPEYNKLMEIMSKYFRPEFLGRLTEIVPFAPLTKDNALKIFEIHLKKEFLDLLKNLDFDLKIEVSEEAKAFLADRGFNSKYGARPLKGIIRSRLRRPLAKMIISGKVNDGDVLTVVVENEEIVWNKR